MKRIAIIKDEKITNVILVNDDYVVADGEMLESSAISAGYQRKVEVNEIPIITVEMTYFKLALVEAGLYQTVLSTIENIPNELDRMKALIWFNNPTVRSDHPLILQFSQMLGISSEQVYAIFSAASQLS